MLLEKSEFIRARETFFNNITQRFTHTKLTNLIACHKIDKKIFKKFSEEVNNYYELSKEYSFQNMTPNGKLVPKKEIENEFNNILVYFYEIFQSMDLLSEISNFIVPAIRYKEPNINSLNKNRSSRSELPHSDSWAGWGENVLLISIPISGDIENNKVVYYDLPNDIGHELLGKRSFENGKKFVNRCNKLDLSWEVGNVYLCDISVIHTTSRLPHSKGRLSLDIPLEFKYHKKIQNEFLKSDFISATDMQDLGKTWKFELTSKMGQIDDLQAERVNI